ncbi:hypothetical protein WJX72_008373 [[Myrmecia] bisecta]|uniref:Amino acid transporter transmembrane domain-containing protein n=1 Tax=[Myrmecia] bisecta TaxID=41462 RepID=A0AAW1PHT9_9CHLO
MSDEMVLKKDIEARSDSAHDLTSDEKVKLVDEQVDGTPWQQAVPLMTVYAILSIWTIHLLTAMYTEVKARRIKNGLWKGYTDKGVKGGRALQYFEVIGELCGKPAKYFVLLITIISLLSTAIAQIIACSTGFYYLIDTVDKRTWSLVWGAILTCTMSMIPTFRHFRIFNVIALVGTAYTAVYLWIVAGHHGLDGAAFYEGPTKLQNLFLGANVFMNAFGGHTMSFEVIDAMFQPSKYDRVYPLSYLFTVFVTVPHSILIQLAFPAANAKYGNVYGVVPVSAARDVSIVLMIIHQFVAYALYITPVFFMFEKLLGTHNKPWFIRLPSRLPVALFVYLIAVLLPFYDTINAIMGSFGNSFTAFVFPAGAYLWTYLRGGSIARRNAPKQPPRFFGGSWTAVFVLNTFIFIYFLVFGVGFGSWASVKNLVDQVSTLGVFASCYQCSQIQTTNRING